MATKSWLFPLFRGQVYLSTHWNLGLALHGSLLPRWSLRSSHPGHSCPLIVSSHSKSGLVCVTGKSVVLVLNEAWLLKPAHTGPWGFVLDLLDHVLWESKPPCHEDTRRRTESFCQQQAPISQLCEWASLEIDPPVSLKPQGTAALADILTTISWHWVRANQQNGSVFPE